MKDIAKISYLERLKRRREDIQRQIDATSKPPSLHERIEKWFSSLPEDQKRREWTMREFLTLFGSTPQKVGTALFESGWTRKRSWTASKPPARYWVKM